jgi:hypothetical protein
MKALLRTLAILASLFLGAQTIRHAYLLWLEPRTSVLDKYDQPLKGEIAAAASLDELLRRYDPVRKEVDRIKSERRAADPKARFEDEQEAEPFKSAGALREAISSWEQRAKEIHALRFYWSVGLLLAVVGAACHKRLNQWLGVTLLIVGFSEIIYWTSPTFLGAATQEFDRLLVNKLVLSVVSLVLLGLAIHLLAVFKEQAGHPA